MIAFEFEYYPEQPDRIFLEVNRRYNIVIEQTEMGLSFRVYPRTDGQLWDYPFATFEVQETEVVTLERDMEANLPVS
jgi:hypothetical protein